MLSALIPSEHSYPAVYLVVKPVHQRFVQPGPLVLGPTLLRYHTPATDRDQPVSRYILLSSITEGMDYTTILISQEIDVLMRFPHSVRQLADKSLRGYYASFSFL